MKSRRRHPQTGLGTASRWAVGVAVAAVVLSLTAYEALTFHRAERPPASLRLAGKTIDRAGVHDRAAEFLAYNNSLTLTAKQQRVMEEALSSIPSPCSSRFSIATSCCGCNLVKTVRGLTKFLITHEHAQVSQIITAVNDWLRFTNPDGYTGDSCATGRCEQPLDANGCGGMDEDHIIL